MTSIAREDMNNQPTNKKATSCTQYCLQVAALEHGQEYSQHCEVDCCFMYIFLLKLLKITHPGCCHRLILGVINICTVLSHHKQKNHKEKQINFYHGIESKKTASKLRKIKNVKKSVRGASSQQSNCGHLSILGVKNRKHPKG